MMRHTPELIRRLYGKKLLWRIKPDEKVIYLTFDDGPCKEVTPQLLDILDNLGVKASFFCLGKNVAAHPEIFEEIKKRGHAVGNHTYNHLNGFKTGTEAYVQNAKKADELIQSKLFRPPYGKITLRQAKRLSADYRVVMWDIVSYDFDNKRNAGEILDLIRRKSRNGSVVVFHDSLKAQKNMLEAVPQAIQFWLDEGYRLKTIE